MLVKVSSETLAASGAKGAEDFSEKLSTILAEHQAQKDFMEDSQITLASLKQNIEEMEKTLGGKIAALETKCATKDDVREIAASVANGVMASNLPVTKEKITEWAASDEGKKIIGAEASRIAMEANAAIGVIPAKPAPAPAAGGTSEDQAKALIAGGKYEEAYALLPAAEKADFVSAKNYAAYMRNRGNTKITARD